MFDNDLPLIIVPLLELDLQVILHSFEITAILHSWVNLKNILRLVAEVAAHSSLVAIATVCIIETHA